MHIVFITIFVSLLFSGCYTQIIEDMPPQLPEIKQVDTLFISSIPSSTVGLNHLGSKPTTIPPGYQYKFMFHLETMDSLGPLADNFYLSWSSPNGQMGTYMLTGWDVKRITKYKFEYTKNISIRYEGTYCFFITPTYDLKKVASLWDSYKKKCISFKFPR